MKLKFKADLVKLNWDDFCLTANANNALAHFLKMVNKHLDKHAPYKTIKYSKTRYETKPWITRGLANSITNINCTKASAKKKIRKQKNIMKNSSNHIVIIYLHCSERQKILTISNILKTTKKNLRLVWQTIKGIINMKKKSDESIFSLLLDGQIITSVKEISNYLNNFFASVAVKINKNIVKTKKSILILPWP